MVILGFEPKKTGKANKDGSDAQNNHESLVQDFYGDVAAITLGGGDFALQFSCAAFIKDGKIYASPFGGKKSPYRSFTLYWWVAHDRKRDHLWVSLDFGGEDTELVFGRYAVESSNDDYDVRIIPPGLRGPTAKALFRDLIAQSMALGGNSQLHERIDLDPRPTPEERAAIVLNDSEQCRKVQAEGEPLPLRLDP